MARYERKDRLHQRAKDEGLRSRAAYKLEELQKEWKLLRSGQRVFDLGCWPGGWLEVAAKLVGPSGRVVGVDLAAVEPPIPAAQVVSLVGDLEDPATAERLREALGTERADVVLSDAAPKLTGVRERDRANEERLLEAIEALLAAAAGEGRGVRRQDPRGARGAGRRQADPGRVRAGEDREARRDPQGLDRALPGRPGLSRRRKLIR
jgi:cell division protein FtsJ